MNQILLPQKAKTYSRHISLSPVVDVKNLTQKSSIYDEQFVFKNVSYKRKQKRHKRKSVLLLFIIFLMTVLASVLLLASEYEIASVMQNVVYDFFVPKDLGRIKFVNKSDENEQEAFGSSFDFGMPFVCSVGQNFGDTFVLKSGGEITIKCAADGVVEDVSISSDGGFSKSVIVSHGKNLKTEYYLLDTVGVKKGDRVQKNTVLGLNQNGEVGLKILFNGKAVKGLKLVDGELSFD